MKNIKDLLSSVSFFHNMNIDVINEYTDDPYPKCFLILSKDDGAKYKIRLSINEKESNVEKELKVFQYLQARNIKKVPQIYHHSLHGDVHLLIYEYLEGASLNKIENLSKYDYDIILSDLIETIEEFKYLKHPQCNSFTKTHKSWFDYFTCKMDEYLDSEGNKSIFSSNEICFIKQICKSFEDEIRSRENGFMHYDIKPKNIVYNRDNKKAYLIDYELGRFGDNLMEFSKLESRSENEDYTNYLVNPLHDYFNVNKTYGRNTFTLYLFFCYILYHCYYYEVFLTTKEMYYYNEAERFKVKSRDLLSLW